MRRAGRGGGRSHRAGEPGGGGGRCLKLRYRAVTRNHAWLKRRTAAVNLRNLLGHGLTRRADARVLAT